MTIQRKVRVPFQPLSHELEHLAKENELMINYNTSNAYIRKGINNIQIPSINNIQDIYDINVQDLIGDTEYDTLEKIESLIKPLYKWKDDITKDDLDNLVNNLKDILSKFSDMSENEGTIAEMLLKKIDIEYGKGLSTNNFTIDHKDKLDGIKENANRYIHPIEKQCNYEAPVKTVNTKDGAIVLTKKDIAGLENVDPDANNYKHPLVQQCSHRFPVTTVNGKDGNVTLSKQDIKLDIVKNYGVASSIESIDPTINNKYLIVKNTNSIIKDLINSII